MATNNPPKYVESHNLLEGKVVVVTAAAGTGIGSAVARRCIEEGATVIISDVHEKRLDHLIGIKTGFIIPIKKRNTGKYYYY